jgi:hydroxysqualene dehydroxylase
MARGPGLRVAVVGAGWAGLAAAVRSCEAGHAVTLFETARQAGGRARSVEIDGMSLDNGQHILIGAYVRTLALMRTVGADTENLFCRLPLVLRYPDGRGLKLPPGPAMTGFLRAVATCDGWSWGDRLRLLAAALGWTLRRFECSPALTVEELCRRLPTAVRELLIDPLCVAALNTPAPDASARVLLRVLHDALASGPGSADLLLPRRNLGEVLPAPALHWLAQRGAALRMGQRAGRLAPSNDGWQLDGEPFDAVLLACSASEAARLTADVAPDWSACAAALRYEPIITVYLRCPGAQLPEPMMALVAGEQAPAQFAFDHGALGGVPGVFAFVISGAAGWVKAGLEETARATGRQALEAFPAGIWPQPPELIRALAEKRATFRCTPGLDRPPADIAPGLWAAGDYIAGPYPATLEGAVRSGEEAAARLDSRR